MGLVSRLPETVDRDLEILTGEQASYGGALHHSGGGVLRSTLFVCRRKGLQHRQSRRCLTFIQKVRVQD